MIIVALGGLGFLLYLYSSKNTSVSQNNNPVTIYSPSGGWVSEDSREYKNLLLHFSLIYPKDLIVKEYDDGTSASTITFEDATGEKSFQIFVVPYQGNQITEEQFKKDVPSGVMKEPVDIMIDDIRATMFFSTNTVLGETREVWFIRGGFLYEITTYAGLDSWLAQILSTWRFN